MMPTDQRAALVSEYVQNTAPVESTAQHRQHPGHALLLASLLLSAYQEFLAARRGLDGARNAIYNEDKNSSSGGEDAIVG